MAVAAALAGAALAGAVLAGAVLAGAAAMVEESGPVAGLLRLRSVSIARSVAGLLVVVVTRAAAVAAAVVVAQAEVAQVAALARLE